jgi:superfamily I DNA/RNA helicase
VTKRERLVSLVKAVDRDHPACGEAWSVCDVARWASILPAVDTDEAGERRVLRRGAKAALAALAAEDSARRPVTRDELLSWFEPRTMREIAERLSDPLALASWWRDLLTDRDREVASYPVEVYLRHGLRGVVGRPRIHPSTVHAVKGGEADVVYLFPDVPYPAHLAAERSEAGKASIVRTFYVGMTRARERLVLCSPATEHHVWWEA